jgi:hypothetical protein
MSVDGRKPALAVRICATELPQQSVKVGSLERCCRVNGHYNRLFLNIKMASLHSPTRAGARRAWARSGHRIFFPGSGTLASSNPRAAVRTAGSDSR